MKYILWETKDRRCKGGGCHSGESREPMASQPIAGPLSQSFWGMGSAATGFELLSFMLEEGRRKSKQRHPQSYQHLVSSLVQ